MKEKYSKEEIKSRAEKLSSLGGIQPHAEVFYIYSILYSSDRCLEAFKRYDQMKIGNDSASVLISTVQEAIAHAAALSRFFWPSEIGGKNTNEMGKLKRQRAEKLREKFDLNDTSVLKNRNLRNAWEHFDEKLDYYLLQNEAGYFFPTPLIDDHTLADDPVGKIFKLLDPVNECFVLLNEKYFYNSIREEVQKIYNKALSKAKNERL